MNTHLVLIVIALAFGVVLSSIHFVKPADAQPIDEIDPLDLKTLQYASLRDIDVPGGFWGERIAINHKTTIPHSFEQSERTGRIANFERAGGLSEGEHQGFFFNDSDVYKIVEGAAYSLMLHPDPQLESYCDDLIAKFAAAQEENGYLNTYYTLAEPHRKWTDIRNRHELYCAGHLFEAAVAYHHATGKRALLDVAIKLADHIDDTFGPGKNMHPPGHQEIEVGLVRLYEATGEERYLKLAQFFLDQRGNAEERELYGPYSQDHAPVTEQIEAVGHAVRACYLYTGMTDVAERTRNEQYFDALETLWDNVVSQKLYITGSVGASRAGEAFGRNYELENQSAYAETCASIAFGMWNARMFRTFRDAKYIDTLERVIYNGSLSGVALDGDSFYYPNPLAADGKTPFNHGSAERSAWFGCACCPPNIARFIPTIARYMYAHDGSSEVYVNLFNDNEVTLELEDGKVTIKQETNYPWDGEVKLTITAEGDLAKSLAMNVRLPSWAWSRPTAGDLYEFVDDVDEQSSDQVQIRRNGQRLRIGMTLGYARFASPWNAGDEIELHLPMPVRRVLAHENVEANRGRVALQRGPVVYCIESADFDGVPVETIVLRDDVHLTAQHDESMLGGVTTIAGTAVRVVRTENGEIIEQPEPFRAIPYYAWSNRGANAMQVWIARDKQYVPEPPVPTIAFRAKPSASHCWGSDTIWALNDQEEPESSHNQDIPRHTWWPRRGSVEWVQYDLDEPTTVSSTSIYWFDDTGIGHCRIPESWRLLYRDAASDDEVWHEVKLRAGHEYESRVDHFCTIEFEPVNASALRIEATLQPEYSGGILEWKVE